MCLNAVTWLVRARAEQHLRVVLEADPYGRLADPERGPHAEPEHVLLFLAELHGPESQRFVVCKGFLDVFRRLELPCAAHEPGLLVLVQHDVVMLGTAAQELLSGGSLARVLERERDGRKLGRPRDVRDVQCNVAELPIAKIDWHVDSSGRRVPATALRLARE
jgi:hypothetical protein